MVLILILFAALAVIRAMLAPLNIGPVADAAVRLLRWPLRAVVMGLSLTVLSRHTPNRRPPQWRGVTWGGGVATVSWLVLSITFSIYLEGMANFDASHGALAAPTARWENVAP